MKKTLDLSVVFFFGYGFLSGLISVCAPWKGGRPERVLSIWRDIGFSQSYIDLIGIAGVFGVIVVLVGCAASHSLFPLEKNIGKLLVLATIGIFVGWVLNIIINFVNL